MGWLLSSNSGDSQLLWMCCGGATLVDVLWKGYILWASLSYSGAMLVEGLVRLLRNHFGGCAVEELAWATLGPLPWICCGGAVGYSGPTLVNVLWRGECGLLWAHFRECAVEELVWATLGPLCWMGCGRASGLLRAHFRECAMDGLVWAGVLKSEVLKI